MTYFSNFSNFDSKTSLLLFKCVSMRHSHVFNFCPIFSKDYILFFNSLLCMGLQTSVLGSYLLSKMAAEKSTENPLNHNLRKSKKQNIGLRWFKTADDEYCHIYIACCIIDRSNNGNNGYHENIISALQHKLLQGLR